MSTERNERHPEPPARRSAARRRKASALVTEAEAKIYVASQWQLIWHRFRKAKLAVYSSVFIVCSIRWLSCRVPGALRAFQHRFNDYVYAPPQTIHFSHEGQWRGPFVYGYESVVDLKTFKRVHKVDTSEIYPLSLFRQGRPLSLLGVGGDRHSPFWRKGRGRCLSAGH